MARKLIDIGANLTDKVFTGIYRGTQLHPNDFDCVLRRAKEKCLEKIIITGGLFIYLKTNIQSCLLI